MVIVVAKLHSSWKWIVSTKMQSSYNWIAMNYDVYSVNCNFCNLFDNTHNVEIWWIASHRCNSETKL